MLLDDSDNLPNAVPNEVWNLILDSASPSTLASVCPASSRFYSFAVPCLCHDPLSPEANLDYEDWKKACITKQKRPEAADLVRIYHSPHTPTVSGQTNSTCSKRPFDDLET